MPDFTQIIAREFFLSERIIQNILDLVEQGATIPFIARYRKEKTNSLDEVQIRNILERYNYLIELEKRRQSILASINSQNKLSEQLKQKISYCWDKAQLEDLYLPYKPKRRTRARIAQEKGLTPLAESIEQINVNKKSPVDLQSVAQRYLNQAQGLKTIEEVLKGASDILAEQVAENAAYRSYLRKYLFQKSFFVAQIKDEYPEKTTKYEIYRQYRASIKQISPHSILALYRGEAEGIIALDISFEREEIFAYLEREVIKNFQSDIYNFYRQMLQDSFNRLLKPALIREIRNERKAYADLESIKTFEANLRELLLSSPAGMKPTLAIDPGFRTGCKVVVLSKTGDFMENKTIYPHSGGEKPREASEILQNLIIKHKIELIAIGNGTASRETERFVSQILKQLKPAPIKVMVNESGASIYSASDLAREEFPDLDVTIRGAISIGRRLQDPLAELVKIDPKSLGVGQYQHDVDQKLLKQKLRETVESCVNYVGVDLNTASVELLTFISGINKTVANNIVKYRQTQGAFTNRQQLLRVSQLGAKAFEQCAGFLRIRQGDNPLDNTAVHPESYPLVEKIAESLGITLDKITTVGKKLTELDLQQFVTDEIGLPTIIDAIAELEKPGRDPRAEFKYATFREDVATISDLKAGMPLEGIITNVVNFGAFVDIGVHQAGLIHISQLANKFVKDPNDIVKVGQIVKVRVLEVNEKLNRISLSLI